MKRRLLVVIIFSMVLATTACGGASGADSTGTYEGATNSFMAKEAAGFEEDAAESYDMDVDATTDEGGEEVDLSGYDTSRKLVYNSNISLESKKFDEDVAKIKELVSEKGGYLESNSTYGNAEYGGRSASMLARIPADKYQEFMSSAGDVGALTSKSENVEDITSSYVDVQARLKSLNTKLERLQELEAQADNLTDLLEIEDRINDVQYQIESYTAQKKTYDDKIDYSTVTIDINEVVTYSEVKADNAWNRFKEAFGDSFAGFVAFLQGLVIAIIYMLPYIIIIALVLFIIIKVRKKKGKAPFFKRKKKDVGKEE